MRKREIKYLLWIVVAFLLVTLVIGLCLKLPDLPFIGGSDDAWIGYWGGAIGSIFGIIGAYVVMRFQFDHDRRETDREKETMLVLSNKYSIKFPLKAQRDTTNNITLQLINGGITPAFNIFVFIDFPASIMESVNDDRKEKVSKSQKEPLEVIPVIMPGESKEITVANEYFELFFDFLDNREIIKEEDGISLIEFFLDIDYENYKQEDKHKQLNTELPIASKDLIFDKEKKASDFSSRVYNINPKNKN
jgi:hypothetical protein